MEGKGSFQTKRGDVFAGHWNSVLKAGFGEVTFDGVRYENVGWTYNIPFKGVQFEPLQNDLSQVNPLSQFLSFLLIVAVYERQELRHQ